MTARHRWCVALVAAASLLAGCASTGGTLPTISTTVAPAPVWQTSASPAPPPPPLPAPSSTTAPVLPLAGQVIVVDPGHNGRWQAAFGNQMVPSGHGTTKACNTAGAQTRDGYPEHAYNWAQALALRQALEARGATVVLTRPDDDSLGPCVNQRAQVANDVKADLLISLHADGNTDPDARGFHVIHSTTMEGGEMVEAASAEFARRVRDALAGTPMPPSSYIGAGTALSPRSDLATLNLLIATPGVMVEAGNMRSAEDAVLLSDAAFQAAVAEALTQAAVAQLVDR